MFLFFLQDVSSKALNVMEHLSGEWKKNEIGLIFPHSFPAVYPGVKLAILEERAEMLASQ